MQLQERTVEDLVAFLAVRPHKSRHGCVTLPFKALTKALGR